MTAWYQVGLSEIKAFSFCVFQNVISLVHSTTFFLTVSYTVLTKVCGSYCVLEVFRGSNTVSGIHSGVLILVCMIWNGLLGANVGNLY